ncbi:hypothetical protein BJV74DRAFT_838449 [Russula compacta]|nr:hypothetical protein BJV74DRAFT_838449 [Russula compacta]
MFSEPIMTPMLGTSDEHLCDGTGALYKIHENSLGSFQSIATREGNTRRTGFQPSQEADSSLFSWRSNIQFYHSRAATILSHEEMSLCQLSPQQLEGTLVSKDTQEDPEPGSDLNSEYDDKTFWEQHYCADCGKQYRRVQELRRHTRDKHEEQRSCPFCDYTWSRPERIRGHLITEHGDRLTEEENQEIRRLRGWKNTIHFLTRFETITPPPESSMLSAQAPVPPQPFLRSTV